MPQSKSLDKKNHRSLRTSKIQIISYCSCAIQIALDHNCVEKETAEPHRPLQRTMSQERFLFVPAYFSGQRDKED